MTEDMVIGGHAATRLRRLLAENQIILAPRVYDGFNARIALEVGFDCLYIVSQPLFSSVPSNQSSTV
jgi:2-methylisocitrate lyase-like PEP mutase family enzyme